MLRIDECIDFYQHFYHSVWTYLKFGSLGFPLNNLTLDFRTELGILGFPCFIVSLLCALTRERRETECPCVLSLCAHVEEERWRCSISSTARRSLSGLMPSTTKRLRCMLFFAILGLFVLVGFPFPSRSASAVSISMVGWLVCSTISAPSNALVHLLLAFFEFLRFHSPQPPSLIRFFNPHVGKLNLLLCFNFQHLWMLLFFFLGIGMPLTAKYPFLPPIRW